MKTFILSSIHNMLPFNVNELEHARYCYLMLKAMTPISSNRRVLVPHARGVFVSPMFYRVLMLRQGSYDRLLHKVKVLVGFFGRGMPA